MKKSLLFFCFAFLLLNVFAQTKTWSGPAGGLWSTAANWTPAVVPGPGDTVIFNSLNVCVLDINTTIASLRAMGVGGNIATSAAQTLTINNNGASSPVLSVASTANLSLGSGAGLFLTTYGAGGTNNAQIAGNLIFNAATIWEINNVGLSNLTNVDVSGVVVVAFDHTGPLFNNSNIATTRFLSGSSLFWSRNGGNIPAADYQNGSIINVNGISNTMVAFSAAANYNGLLMWGCLGQTISGASAILLPASNYPMDSILVTNTGSGTLRLASEPAYTLGNIEAQGGTLEMSAPVLGNSTGIITGDLNIAGGTVIGNATFATDVANIFSTTISVNGNLTMTTGTFTLTNRPISGALSGAFKLNVAKNVSQTGGTITAVNGFSLFPNSITLNGTLAQNLAMTTFSGPMLLEINNSSATGVTLTSPVTIPTVVAPVTASLVLTNGVVKSTTTNLLTMASGSAVSGASNNSFVDGPVKKIGNTAFTFPVGKTTCGVYANLKGYVALGISNFIGGAATDQFTAEYKRGDASALGAGTISNPGIKHVSRCDYWTLTRDLGSSTVDIKAYWDSAINNCVTTSPYINDLPTLTIAHNNNIAGAQWDNLAAVGSYNGTVASGDISWTGTQSGTFGAFALASTSFGTNPLPITLNYLNGIKQNGAHYLNWKVTCFNNASATMVLERSADGRNFNAINTITADALRCEQPFDHTDNSPLAGMNYYRLKMIDANGKITYSNSIALLNKETGFDIVNLVPTLVTGNAVLNITAAQKTKMDIVITDISGRQVQKIAYNLIAGSNQFTINLANLSAGTYQMKGYAMDGVSRTIRFVKQ